MLILLNVGREVYHTGLPCNILCKSLLKGFSPRKRGFQDREQRESGGPGLNLARAGLGAVEGQSARLAGLSRQRTAQKQGAGGWGLLKGRAGAVEGPVREASGAFRTENSAKAGGRGRIWLGLGGWSG